MAQDIKYTVAEMEELAKTAERLKDVLSEDYKQVFANINALLKEFNNSFGVGTDKVEDMLSASEELRDKHHQMVELSKKYIDELKKISKFEEDFANSYGVSIERAKELVSLKAEEHDLTNQIKLTTEKLTKIGADLTSTASARKSISEEINRLEEEASKLGENQVVEYQKKLYQIQALNKAIEDVTNLEQLQAKYDDVIQAVGSYDDATIEAFNSAIDAHNSAKQSIQAYGDELQRATDGTVELARATERWERENQESLAKITSGVKALLGEVKKFGLSAISKYGEIDNSVITFGRTVGLSTQAIKAHKASVLEHYDEMASRLGMTFEEIFKFQEQYTRNTGRAVMLTNQQVESLAEMSKLTSPESVEKMTANMDDFGASTETATDYLALNMARARSQGLDAAKASEAFANNIKMASRYSFREGINGVSKMTLLSQRLKFNMESIGATIEKFSTIEGAIETSANIQMLGGSYAMNFSNPLDAMGEALMDAEGFIKRIVNTVSTQATFNRQTGMVDMSGFEKARLREFAKQMGLNYDEAWNMVAQQTKIQAMGSELGKGKWSENEEALIANKAQFNTEKNRWEIALPGRSEATAITDLTSKMLEELKDVAELSDEDLRTDVHYIRQDLRKFIDKTFESNRSYQEMLKGLKENTAITMAQGVSYIGDANWFRNDITDSSNSGGDGLENILYGLLGLKAISQTYTSFNGKNPFGGLGKKFMRYVRRNKKPLTSVTTEEAPSAKVSDTRTRRASLKGRGIKGAKIGGTVGMALGLYDASRTWLDYKQNKNAIENSTLSQEEKEVALDEAKKSRNNGYAQTAGSTIGGLLGGALFSLIPGAGPVLASVGATLGAKAGSAIGSALVGGGENQPSTSMTSMENSDIQTQTEQLALLTSIDTTVQGIARKRSDIQEAYISRINSYTTRGYSYGDKVTYFNQHNNNLDKNQNINTSQELKLSGTIRFVGDKGLIGEMDASRIVAEGLRDNLNQKTVYDITVKHKNEVSNKSPRVDQDSSYWSTNGGINNRNGLV